MTRCTESIAREDRRPCSQGRMRDPFTPHPSIPRSIMPDFMQEYWFMGLMVVLLIGLVVLMMKLRNKRDED